MAYAEPDHHAQDAAQPRPGLVALMEVFAYYNHHCTEFEGEIWKALLEQHGDKAMCTFLKEHMLNSRFRPMVEDARKFFDPGRNDADAALLKLHEVVSAVGPYGTPRFDDGALAEAVRMLGGWPEVNRLLPDPAADRHAYREFGDRFSAAYRMAASSVARGLAIGHSPQGLIALQTAPAPSAVPQLELGLRAAPQLTDEVAGDGERQVERQARQPRREAMR